VLGSRIIGVEHYMGQTLLGQSLLAPNTRHDGRLHPVASGSQSELIVESS
jgi:hypothetical protein